MSRLENSDFKNTEWGRRIYGSKDNGKETYAEGYKNVFEQAEDDNDKLKFAGPERYYSIAGRELDKKRNSGSDDYVDALSKPRKISRWPIIVAIILLVTFVFAVFMATSSLVPLKVANDPSDRADVKNTHGIIKDEKTLEKTLNSYHELTGACPVVHTTYDEMWKDDYMNLDVYSQDILNGLENMHSVFPHVLVVYSVPKDSAATDGKLIILRGRDTKAVFTWFDTLKFKSVFNQSIKDGKDAGTAMNDAFKVMYDRADVRMNPPTTIRWVKFFLAFLPFIITLVVFIVLLVRTIKRNNRERNIEYVGAPEGNAREPELSNESETVDFNNDSVT